MLFEGKERGWSAFTLSGRKEGTWQVVLPRFERHASVSEHPEENIFGSDYVTSDAKQKHHE